MKRKRTECKNPAHHKSKNFKSLLDSTYVRILIYKAFSRQMLLYSSKTWTQNLVMHVD